MRQRTPGPLLRRLLRAPARLYDWHLGWLLGRRFLRLTHVGRVSGRTYHTMLEVVGENRARNELIVVAGLGRSAQWYRNIQTREPVEVAIARERFVPIHRDLSLPDAEAVLAGYEQRNRWLAPVIRRVLSWLVGWRYDGTQPARRRLVAQLPLIGLRPAARDSNTSRYPA
jgi:deazaflavin-dependent oxidoreductase (nitroreductase family)